MEFEQWFKERSRRFERILINGAVFFLFMLLVIQALHTVPGIRRVLSMVDRLEGEPFVHPGDEAAAVIPATGQYLVLTLLEKSAREGVLVRVNDGQEYFFDESGTITVPVEEGDVVEIDGEEPERELEIVISATSDRVVSPQSGTRVLFYGLPETVGWVMTGEP